MLKFTIEPYDVLFFGSGKPFNIGSNVESIFPPFPHSFAAAVYAKFVSEKGITIRNGKGIYKAVYGPFIEKSGVFYFPAPSDILQEKKKEESSKFKIADRCNQFSLINIHKIQYKKLLLIQILEANYVKIHNRTLWCFVFW